MILFFRKIYGVLFALFLLATVFTGCVEENVTTDQKFRIEFSTDTVVFDTLFSGQMSATKRLMVYNRNKQAINIEKIIMAGGKSSNFRFNVDGRIATSDGLLGDIVIRAKDSVFVFIETTAPSIEEMEMLVTDSLMFFYNGNADKVQLASVGRSARLLHNYSVPESQHFTDSIPYVVYGYLHVPQSVMLTLAEGCEIYMHGGSNIVVDGVLRAEGTFEKPVRIRTDRYDKINDVAQTPFANMPNQWGAVYLQNADGEHLLRNCDIRGGSMGIVMLGSARNQPTLTVRNSVIHNMGSYGIYAQQSSLTIENSEISNCGASCVSLIGGEAYIAHTTIANYYRFAYREEASLVVANQGYSNGVLYSFPITSFVAENSIIFGSHDEEVLLSGDEDMAQFNVLFSHCLIKGKKIDAPMFADCRWSRSQNEKNALDTVFVNCVNVDNADSVYYDFRLDSLSFARNGGSVNVAVKYPLDLDNQLRNDDGKPDMGAYELRDK